MQNIIKIHPLDNVAVALQDLAADERIESGEFSVKTGSARGSWA